MTKLSRLRRSPFQIKENEGDIPDSKQLVLGTDLEHSDYLRDQFEQAGIVYPANHILQVLSDAFGRAIGGIEAGKRFYSAFLRVNDASVTGFHKHFTSLTYTFRGQVVICRSGEELDEGNEYQVGSNTVFIFDETVPHKSPEFKPSWKSKSRVSITMVSPE
ncbi:MAG: hypothetical protein GC137_09390 [Alphaproteobacteria bacterium]|nr:hypothetical protein [Alphaproteobacteria bacterium]